jgi:hypothetical protein
MNVGYQGNPNLPKLDYKHTFSQYELEEFKKCANDPIYFAKKYIKIVNVDKGLVPFNMWDFQEKMISNFHENRFSINLCPRQVGKTTCAVSFLLYYIIFNENVNVAILANKASTSREIMSRLQLAFEYLPNFIKMGVLEWNKGSIVLSNGSKVQADSTSGSSIRGRSFNIIFLDEFAFVPPNIAESFFSSTYPTISSGQTTKVIIVSTPNGIGNLFYKLWIDATEKRNLYSPFSVHWSNVPGRDEKWKEETIRNTSIQQFQAEFECEFLGSSNTLISASKLKTMAWINPIHSENGFDIIEESVPGRIYAIMVDVARGQGLDYSAFSVIDVTEIPYKQVAKYRNNEISALLYPTIIYNAARKYNDAYVLVEISDIGQQISDILHYELEYENLVKIQVKGRQGLQVSAGHVKKIAFGLKQSVATKRIGCANLKTLIESDKLIIQDSDTIMELTTFTAQKDSFKAEEGNHDDLAMTLVIFGWFTAQRHFKDALKDDIRKVLQQEQLNMVDEDIVPFGAIDNGVDLPIDDTDRLFDNWMNERQKKYPMDSYEYDYKGEFFKKG